MNPEDVQAGSPPWHTLPAQEVGRRLGTGPRGLAGDEAVRRQARYGRNVVEAELRPSALAILAHQFASPLIFILLVAVAVTVVLGDYVDAAVIAAVLILNAAIGFVQERRAEAAVHSLMALVAPHARVVRDGREWDVEGADLVPGDLVLLETGSRVPADLRLSHAAALFVDESALTGESLPVEKDPSPLPADVEPADRRNMAFAGTVVTSGRGRGYVVAIGDATSLGRIAERVHAEAVPQTPLQERMAVFARVIVATVIGASALAFAVGVWIGESASEMFTVAVALAVSAVPEGLPVVFTITLAIGVQRMARRNAIVRRLPAVETLGEHHHHLLR